MMIELGYIPAQNCQFDNLWHLFSAFSITLEKPSPQEVCIAKINRKKESSFGQYPVEIQMLPQIMTNLPEGRLDSFRHNVYID